MTTPSARQTRRGVSLIELIAVIVIIGVAMPPMMLTLADTQQRRASPILADTARWLAAEQLEQIIADRHSPTRGLDHITTDNYPPEPSINGFTAFSRQTIIEQRSPALEPGGEGVVLVTVQVSWTDPALGMRTTTVSVAFAEIPS